MNHCVSGTFPAATPVLSNPDRRTPGPREAPPDRGLRIGRQTRLTAIYLASLSFMTFAGAGDAAEEPAYQLVRKLDGVELRRYAPYTVAEVMVPGPAGDAGAKAFPILSDYIFGRNKDERKFAMTAPVTQTATGTTLETAELAPPSGAAPGFLVQFVLPKGITVATAPEPLDPRVRVREVSPGHVAVIRYSGFWSEANYTGHLARLRESLQAAGMTSTGEPIYARYNAPFTPWFMRRNEIWLRLVGERGGSIRPLPVFAGR